MSKKEKLNNKKEPFIIPIEFENQKLNTYLSLSENNNNELYINLNESQEELNNQINEIAKLLLKHEETIKNYNDEILNNKYQLTEIHKEINKKENEILNQKKKI